MTTAEVLLLVESAVLVYVTWLCVKARTERKAALTERDDWKLRAILSLSFAHTMEPANKTCEDGTQEPGVFVPLSEEVLTAALGVEPGDGVDVDVYS